MMPDLNEVASAHLEAAHLEAAYLADLTAELTDPGLIAPTVRFFCGHEADLQGP